MAQSEYEQEHEHNPTSESTAVAGAGRYSEEQYEDEQEEEEGEEEPPRTAVARWSLEPDVGAERELRIQAGKVSWLRDDVVVAARSKPRTLTSLSTPPFFTALHHPERHLGRMVARYGSGNGRARSRSCFLDALISARLPFSFLLHSSLISFLALSFTLMLSYNAPPVLHSHAFSLVFLLDLLPFVSVRSSSLFLLFFLLHATPFFPSFLP